MAVGDDADLMHDGYGFLSSCVGSGGCELLGVLDGISGPRCRLGPCESR